MKLEPRELIETASLTEAWTGDDRRHCERMLSGLATVSGVQSLHLAGNGLIAFDAPASGIRSVRLRDRDQKPLLAAIERLAEVFSLQ